MRLIVPMRRAALFGVMFALALVLFLPLRLALGGIDGLSARDASGSVWAGRLAEARVGPVTLGDVRARLSWLPLLAGQVRFAVDRPSAAADQLVGAFSVSRSRRSADAVTGEIPIDPVFGSLPIGSFELTDVTVQFRDGACDHADGVVRANLSGEASGLPLPASLSGAVRCDRGALLLPLRSGSGTEGLALRIFGDGRYEARLSARSADPAVMEKLTGAGLTLGPSGYSTTMRGRF